MDYLDQRLIPVNPAPVIEEFGRYSDMLNVGAAEALGRQFSDLANLPAGARAERVRQIIDGPMGAMHRNPAFEPAKKSPLREALERRSDRLSAPEIDALETQWAGQAAFMTPAGLAGQVADHINRPVAPEPEPNPQAFRAGHPAATFVGNPAIPAGTPSVF